MIRINSKGAVEVNSTAPLFFCLREDIGYEQINRAERLPIDYIGI